MDTTMTKAASIPLANNNVWKSPEKRQKVVNKIMEYLKEHLPVSEQQGLLELKETAVRFEESSYTAATSHTDYLKRISQKLLTMVAKSQPPIVNAPQPNPGTDSRDPIDSGMLSNQQNQHMVQQSVDTELAPLALQQSADLILTQATSTGTGSRAVPPTSSETGNRASRYPIPPGSRERVVNKM